MLNYQRSFLLLALAFLPALAAISGHQKGDTDMGQNLQPYNVPISGRVPPIRPGSTLNDEFNRQHPDAALDPLGAPGLVSLDPKWTPWNADALGLCAIAPQNQMLIMAGNVPKAWAGAFQDLPVPALGESIDYQIYARVMLGEVAPVPAAMDWGPFLGGLILGVDLRGNPLTSDFWSIHFNASSTGDGGLVNGIVETAAWESYNFPLAADISLECGWPLTFLRANVVTSQDAPDVYSTNLIFAASPDGDAFTNIFRYDLAVPLRQVALAQRAEVLDQDFSTFHDFIRYMPTPQAYLGARQQLGSV